MDELPRVVSEDAVPLPDFHWLKMVKQTYLDPSGATRTWEMVERTTRKGNVDAVVIAAIRNHTNPRSIVVVKQFRPPVRRAILEMPAGLIDNNENPGVAALRELREETGFTGRVISISPIVYSDPGLTSANMQLVEIEIDASCIDPKQNLDDGEFIDVLQFPYDNLLDHLLRYCKESNCVLDSRLHSYAAGLKAGTSIAQVPHLPPATSTSSGIGPLLVGFLAGVAIAYLIPSIRIRLHF